MPASVLAVMAILAYPAVASKGSVLEISRKYVFLLGFFPLGAKPQSCVFFHFRLRDELPRRTVYSIEAPDNAGSSHCVLINILDG